jgi:hypothetical protein
MKVINDYRIILKIGYFVIDNVRNNDIMIDALSTCMSFYMYMVYYSLQHLLTTLQIVLFD